MKSLKSRKRRLELIAEFISNRCISNQKDLIKLLLERGCKVSQGTLSRDLRALKTTKVPTDGGVLMYVLPETNSLKDKFLIGESNAFNSNFQTGFISIHFSGNIAVIKTRNGYASGLAFDIDAQNIPEILGTIPGSDTIFVVLREDVSRIEAVKIFSTLLPMGQL